MTPPFSPDPPALHESVVGTQRVHLGYLDGVRGAAAFYVVLAHAVEYAQNGFDTLPYWIRLLTPIFGFSHEAVLVFIVLSGYCLMMPVAGSADGWYRGGVKRFLKRRLWRIVPAYYVAVLACLPLLYCLPDAARMAQLTPHAKWLDFLSPLNFGNIISHLLLLHNLSPNWWRAIDPPSWTVATEFQIYLFMPLLVLVWRRAGPVALVVFSLAVTLLIFHFFKGVAETVNCWFLTCFALGAVVAADHFNVTERAASRFTHLRGFGWSVPALAVVAALVHRAHAGMPYDIVVACATAALLGWLTAGLGNDEAHPLCAACARSLSSPPLAWLGAISYSLYLAHGPILLTLQYFATRHSWNYLPTQALVLAGGLVLSLAAAQLLHVAIERPGMQRRS